MGSSSAASTAAADGENSSRRVVARRSWKRWVVAGVGLPVLTVAAVNAWVVASASGRMTAAAEAPSPAAAVGLVLGTSPRRLDGSPNLHFRHRLDAAAALYSAGKVSKLIVSGATTGRYYDEPRDMRAELKARGVPDSAIVSDPLGVRTLDSVVHAKETFHVRSCAIISDAWHVPRALYIADSIGLPAVGVAAEPVPIRLSLKARSREWLARVLVVLDMHVLDTRPVHAATGAEADLSSVPEPGE